MKMIGHDSCGDFSPQPLDDIASIGSIAVFRYELSLLNNQSSTLAPAQANIFKAPQAPTTFQIEARLKAHHFYQKVRDNMI